MATGIVTTRPPLPPFTIETAKQKVRLAEDGWNTRDPGKVALAYAIDSRWRNRAEFINGRNEIVAFLSRKWARELDYRLIKELWAFTGHRIAVRFAYEWHDDSGHWYRSYGNENWEFNDDGLMASRFACINDLPITEADRKYHWPPGRRPDDHQGLTPTGLIVCPSNYFQACDFILRRPRAWQDVKHAINNPVLALTPASQQNMQRSSRLTLLVNSAGEKSSIDHQRLPSDE
jgi:nuclear transport factor 2 (NTF2) superfamily protein